MLPTQEPGLHDWQCVCRGFWARDVAYFLASVPTIDQRREIEEKVLQHYLDELPKYGGPRITLEEAWPELACQAFGAINYWLHVLTPDPVAMPDLMQPKEITRENIRRILQCVSVYSFVRSSIAVDSFMDDHDSFGATRKLNGGEWVLHA
jgi:hypothetical protein